MKPRHRFPRVIAATLAAATLTAGAGIAAASSAGAAPARPHAANITLTGAGSTFDAPFFTLAFYEYHRNLAKNVTINYAAIGSGGGESAIEQNTVNFGATDVPMMASDLSQAKGPILQIPVALGGVAIAYNVKGVHGGLHLTGPVLARIFLGEVTNWDSSQIQKINPGVKLPNAAITVVHRADGSGTSYAFTNYLNDVSTTWKSKVGVGKTVSWPVGIAGQGNSGVAGLIKDTPDSIGYIELAYAVKNHFTYAKIQNPEGNYVLPTGPSVAAEAALRQNMNSTHFRIVDLSGNKYAYPISTFSWMCIYKTQTNKATGTALVDLAEWLTHGGQERASFLKYAGLPKTVSLLAQNTLEQVVGPAGKSLLTKAAIAKYGKF